MKIDKLKSLIAYHDNLYYNQGVSEITDAEYDALREQLAILEGELDFVPGATTGLFPKYTHSESIASLAKVNDEGTLRKELEKLMPVVIMPKFDGLTVVKYPDAAVTRGNGEIGDDISVNFNAVCNEDFHLPVRGEAIISKPNFKRINQLREERGEEPFKNARNAVAGILRSKENKYINYVSYVVYDIPGSVDTVVEDLTLLDVSHFNVTDHWGFEDVDDAIHFIMNFERDNYPFELDGLVIKTNQEDSINRFGRTGHHPKDSFAYKFEAKGADTVLREVHWTVGRTGKVVPNAIFDPVEILGTTVSNATLHNPAYIEALYLSIGCNIHVVKANDIIPAVVQSSNYDPLRKIVAPSVCPKCESELVKVNDQLYCYNNACASRILAQAVHLVSKDCLDIKGLSEATIEKLFNADYIKKPADILLVTKDEVLSLEGFADKSAEKLYNSIQAARHTTFNRAIVSAGIPNVGRTVSKQIAEVYKDMRELAMDQPNHFARLAQVEGIGEVIIGSLHSQFALINEIYSNLLEVSNPLYKESTNEAVNQLDYVICVTGKLAFPRDYYKDMIESAGATFVASVSRKTTHLLVGEKAGSKLEKAHSLGIPVLTTEQELVYLLQPQEVIS